MQHSCYILFSPELDKFYTGYTSGSLEARLDRHLKGYYGTSKYTHKVKDWVVFLEIECTSSNQARKIEAHIKSMKSKTYINNLKKYPEMIDKILKMYNSIIPEN